MLPYRLDEREDFTLELGGTRLIAADRASVWAHLTNPETLKACIPGCEVFTGSPEEGYEAVVTRKIGPVKVTVKGAVTLGNIEAPKSCRIVGEGQGGVAGFAKGFADVSLDQVEGGTELTYLIDAKVGGKLTKLGGKMVGGIAKKMADQFFERFEAVINETDP